MLELRLAWRNVWRNPRRTVLTVAATGFAVLLVVYFVAMAAGVHEKMIEDSVRLHSGHLAISGHGYLESRTLEQFVRYPGRVEAVLERTSGVVGFAPRVLGFGLLSRDSATQGVAILGADPAREPTVSTLHERVRLGRFVGGPGRREIVLAHRLAGNLGAAIGDQLLLYSTAYSLETAYDLFTVVGVMRLPEPELDRSLAVISLAEAQEFFVYGDRVSEVAVLARDADVAPQVAQVLASALGAGGDAPLEVHTWQERMPELVHFLFLDDAGMYILLAILVVVVGFGILNTILMSVLERTRELGVLVAVGLRPAILFRVIYLEAMMVGLVGLVVGLVLGIALVLYFVAHPVPLTGRAAGALELWGIEPILTWKLKPLNPIGSSLAILGVAALASLQPALKASRSRPVDALRGL